MAIEEKEFEAKLNSGEISEINSLTGENEAEVPNVEQKFTDYLDILTKLRNFFKSDSDVPTKNPAGRLDQEVHYRSGATYRIYKFIKDAWKKVYDSAGLTPAAHKTTHQSGGSDELDVTGLTGAGAWTEEYEVTTGSASQTITVTGLDLDAGKTYKILFDSYNASGSGAMAPRMFANEDFTTTNYFFGRVRNGTYSGANDAYLTTNVTDGYSFGFNLMMNRHGGNPYASGVTYSANNTGTVAWFRDNTANVTSLTFSAGIANGFNTGTHIMILKLTT